MKPLSLLTVGTVLICLAMSACSTMTVKPIERVTWTLTELGGVPAKPAAAGREAFLLFDDGPPQRLSGSTGCNRLAGSYMLVGSRVELGPLGTTKMACLDGMEQEETFLAMLAALDGWSIVDGQLLLLDATGELLARFTAAARD